MRKFGLLSYRNTENLGDEIQSIAIQQFIPRVDAYVDRERLGEFSAREKHDIVLNGWFSHRPETWPPSDQLRPLITSFHLTREITKLNKLRIRPDEFLLRGAALEYLAAHAPIGARDLSTLRMLESAGVDSYFSGCATLTLPRIETPKREEIWSVQLEEDLLTELKRRVHLPIRETTHLDFCNNRFLRFRRARLRLRAYAGARAVVTTRLHAALPCLAMGVPVLLVQTAADCYRFEGLQELVHTVTPDAFLAGDFVFDFDDPPPNRDDFEPIREAMIKRVVGFVSASKEA
jgi:hypothetical protein